MNIRHKINCNYLFLQLFERNLFLFFYKFVEI